MQIPKINILLTTLGITHDDIAEATGVTRSMVSSTIRGDRKSKKTQDRITSYIRERITTDELFKAESGGESGLRPKPKRADLNY